VSSRTPLACGGDLRDQIAGLLGEVRSSRSEDILMELALTTRPARRVEGEIRAPATLVDATFHAIADAGSIPAVSTV